MNKTSKAIGLFSAIAILTAGPLEGQAAETTPTAASKTAGVVIAPVAGAGNFIDFYRGLDDRGEAALVTADAALWAVHKLHDQALAGAEVYLLSSRLRTLVEALMAEVERMAPTLPERLGPAARRLRAFLAVARALSDPLVPVPKDLDGDVRAELKRIAAHEGFAFSSVLDQKMDYSQMTPRGHYTRTDELKRYFLLAMWLGRTTFRLDELHPDSAGFPEDHPPLQGGWLKDVDTAKAAQGDRDALAALARRFPAQGKEEMQAAGLLTLALSQSRLGGKPALDAFDEIETILETWFGPSDDLTVRDLLDGFREVFGNIPKPDDLADESKLLRWIAQIEGATHPRIDSTGMGRRGFCLLGQRSVFDAYVFQNLVAGDAALLNYTGKGDPFTLVRDDARGPIRGFPRGLDLMAVAGNAKARDLLRQWGDIDYEGYDAQADKMADAWVRRFSVGGKGTIPIYDEILKAAVAAADPAVPRRAPDFMKSPESALIRLNAGLAYWSTLRHDSILYAKQSYTGMVQAIAPTVERQPRGYVEPRPDLYRQLGAIAARIASALPEKAGLPEGFSRNAQSVRQLMERLAELSDRELADSRRLGEKDFAFISDFSHELYAALALDPPADEQTGFDLRDPVAIVADVHTRVPLCLEEGVGNLWKLTCEVLIGESQQTVTGAIFSYYEFKQTVRDRLTDEKWRTLLRQRKTPPPLLLDGLERKER